MLSNENCFFFLIHPPKERLSDDNSNTFFICKLSHPKCVLDICLVTLYLVYFFNCFFTTYFGWKHWLFVISKHVQSWYILLDLQLQIYLFKRGFLMKVQMHKWKKRISCASGRRRQHHNTASFSSNSLKRKRLVHLAQVI